METRHVFPLFFFSFATTENILFAKTEKIYESKTQTSK